MSLRLFDKAVRELVGSDLFRGKTQMQALFIFFADRYCHKQGPATQHDIAVDALGRGQDFDGAIDPLVRIEVRRLRALLVTYYDSVASDKCLHYQFSLPKGTYQLVVKRIEPFRLSHGPDLLLICQSFSDASPEASQLALTIQRDLSEKIPLFWLVKLRVSFNAHQVGVDRSHLSDFGDTEFGYMLRVEVIDRSESEFSIGVVLIHQSSREIVWSAVFSLAKNEQATGLDSVRHRLIQQLFVGGGGHIGKHWIAYCDSLGDDHVPPNFRIFLQLLRLKYDSGRRDFERFLRLAEERLNEYPQDHQARLAYLWCSGLDYLLNYDLSALPVEQQLQQAESLIQHMPDSASLYICSALLHYIVGDNEQSASYAYSALAVNAYDQGVRGYAGLILAMLGDWPGVQGLAKDSFSAQRHSDSNLRLPKIMLAVSESRWLDVLGMLSGLSLNKDLERFLVFILRAGQGDLDQAAAEYNKLPDAWRGERCLSWLESRVLRQHPVIIAALRKAIDAVENHTKLGR